MRAMTDSQMCLAMEDKFPVTGDLPEKLRFLVRYAILAPSVRHSQPWKFEVAGDRIDLYLDHSRNRRASDPDRRELVISCGAALEHLKVASRHFGLIPRVVTFPGRDPDLLARFEVDGEAVCADTDTVLFYAIHKWLDVPKPYRTRKKVPSEIVRELVALANKGRTWLHCYEEDDTRRVLADLIARSDIEIENSKAVGRKTAGARGPEKQRRPGDGLMGQAGHVGRYIRSFLSRPWKSGRVLDEYRAEIAGTSPAVAILGSRRDEPEDWLETGQTLAAVLLRGLSVGLHSSFFNQPLEVPAFRQKLVERLGLPEFPQIMFRIGFRDAELRDARVAHPSVHEDML